MRIGVVVDNEYTNDIRVTNECRILSDYGHEVKVLCLSFGQTKTNEIINSHLSVLRLPINRKKKNILFALTNTIDLYSYWWQKKIKRFIKSYDIEALHVHDLFMSKAAAMAIKHTNISLTLDLHENYPFAVEGYQWMNKPLSKYIIRPWAWQKKEKKYLSYATNLIVLSESFKSDLMAKYSFLFDKSIFVFPNVPDIIKLQSYKIQKNILNLNSKSFVLFYFGAVSRRRGIDLLFNSIEKLSQLIPEVKILLVGPVDKHESKWFRDKLKTTIIKKYFIYYEWKDISLLPSLIISSNVCLSPLVKNPQHESGIANKVFQYLLFKRPVIVSNCAPQTELVKQHNCGLDFKWDSVEDFIDKVMYLYNNKDEAIEMGEQGYKAVINHYNTQITKRELLSIYNEGATK